MGQHGFRTGHQAVFLVEDGTHVLVGAYQAFHQHVAFAGVDQLHGHLGSLVVVLLLYDFELVDVDLFVFADFLDHFGIADQGSIDNSQINGFADSGNRMVVHCVSSHQAFFAIRLHQVEQLIQFTDSHISNI